MILQRTVLLCRMKSSTFLLLLFSLFVLVEAKNDWSQPCFNGACSFDVARSNTSMGATFLVVSFLL